MLSINRLPAPPPRPTHWLCKLGWLVTLALGLLTAFLVFRYFTLTSSVKFLTTDAELNRIEVKSLQQQIEAERILTARQIADDTIKGTPEPLVFVRLAPPEASSPRMAAFVAWRAASQTGVFFAEQIPPPAADKEYRLWIETNSQTPISAGEIKVAATGPTQIEFRINDPISPPTRFTITCESKDDTKLSAVVIVLTGAP
ncbi:MAG: anti-sigma factor [Verrucomicrobia bacterium]|nr:anti-sigma factor [Verrucomicrobiota bacterium]